MSCIFVLMAAVAVFPSGARGAGRNSQDLLSRMPADPARQIIVSKCGSACHESGRILDQTRTRNEWTDVVVLMRDYGAKVSIDEQNKVVDYLSKNFGRVPSAMKSAAPPPVTLARASSSGPSRAPSASPTSSSVSSPTSSASRSSSGTPQAGGKVPAPANPPTPGSAGSSAAATSGGLPPGPGKELVQTKCTMCHNLDRVIGSRRTRAEWQELVTNMQEYGADVYDEDEKTVVDYLSKSFPANDSSKGAAGNGAPAR